MNDRDQNAASFRLPGGRPLVKRSLALSGHRTSVALEPEFWTALDEMARARGIGLPALIAGLDAARDPARPLASALRVAALLDARDRGRGQGRGAAGDSG
ncbi:ribbon-helix-helix domain-containing protein [Nguyenibacter vanlangensis]|uniref:Ribbon-helix-helix domain-containing protein n=1 Tax=Nguyenibacter vanlangensis TaxID=1216886 RepID=A0ABZ3DAT3_9PROT